MQEFEERSTALRRTQYDPNPIISRIAYHAYASCESCFHKAVRSVRTGAILQLHMLFIFSYIPYQPNSECVFVKQTITIFSLCKTTAFVHLKVLTSQVSYHGRCPDDSVDFITSFMRIMYHMVVKIAIPLRSTQVFSQQIRNVAVVVTHV